jgi:metal-responsive CopG/Arc/MetJ family transcriptional regulator
MPNQRSDKKRTVTLSMPKSLIAQIDEIAAYDERSRSKLIELMLREEVAQYNAKLKDDSSKKEHRRPLQCDSLPGEPNAN